MVVPPLHPLLRSLFFFSSLLGLDRDLDRDLDQDLALSLLPLRSLDRPLRLFWSEEEDRAKEDRGEEDRERRMRLRPAGAPSTTCSNRKVRGQQQTGISHGTNAT